MGEYLRISELSIGTPLPEFVNRWLNSAVMIWKGMVIRASMVD